MHIHFCLSLPSSCATFERQFSQRLHMHRRLPTRHGDWSAHKDRRASALADRYLLFVLDTVQTQRIRESVTHLVYLKYRLRVVPIVDASVDIDIVRAVYAVTIGVEVPGIRGTDIVYLYCRHMHNTY